MTALLRLWFAFILAVALGGGAAHAEIPPRPAGPVLDQAGLLSPADEAALIEKLRANSLGTGRAVMVAIVSSLDGQDIETYGPALGRAWGVGGKSTDQGLILLVAPAERKVRIEVGYGLEEFMPDVLATRIIRDTIVPLFKADNYVGGINAGVDAILAQLNRDPADAKAVAEAAATAAANNAAANGGSSWGGAIFWIALILFFMFAFGRHSRRNGYRRSGIDPGVVLWGVSEIARGIGSGGGGGFSSSDSGGSDWGGFGGGDFGGGGASGDW